MNLRTLQLAFSFGSALLLATSAHAEPKAKEHAPGLEKAPGQEKKAAGPAAAEKPAAPALSPQEEEIARLVAARKDLTAQIQKLRADTDKHHRAAMAAQMRWKAMRGKKGPKPAKDPLEEAKTETSEARKCTDGLAPLHAQMTASDERLAAIVKQLEDAAAQAKAAAEQAAKTAAEAKKAAIAAAAAAQKAKAKAMIGNMVAVMAKRKKDQDDLTALQQKMADLTKKQSEIEVEAQSQPAPEATPAPAAKPGAAAKDAKPAEAKPAAPAAKPAP